MSHPNGLVDPELDHCFKLSDGRQITYRQFGHADGAPILALHGTPGSRLKYRAAHDAAGQRRLRIIAPDRWGYGRSTPHPSPRICGYAKDARELMLHLGAQSFSVVGISGGGPFAAAMAAELGASIHRLALVAPVGDVGRLHGTANGSIGVEPLRAFHRFCFLILPRIPLAARAVFTVYRLAVMLAPELAVRVALLRSGPDDQRTMSKPESRRSLGRTFAAGLRDSASGPVIDLALFREPWAFDLERIACPTQLWIGDEDRNVPIAAVLDLAERVPTAQVARIPQQGHFWIAENFGHVLDWLGE